MKKQIVILCLLIVCLFPHPAFAARSIIIASDKNSIFGEEELIVSASLSGFMTNEKIYIKGAFYKDGGTNYFGFTKNNDSWIKNSVSAINQRQVEIGSWDNLLNVKIDSADAGYHGKGDYKFKIGFYYLTSGGNVSSVNWSQNNISLSIDAPVPTFTVAPIAKNSSNSTKISNVISKSPTPVKVITTQNISNYPVLSNSKVDFDKIANVKSASQFAKIKPVTKSEEPEKEVLGVKESKNPPLILFSSGAIFLLAAGVIACRRFLKERNIL